MCVFLIKDVESESLASNIKEYEVGQFAKVLKSKRYYLAEDLFILVIEAISDDVSGKTVKERFIQFQLFQNQAILEDNFQYLDNIVGRLPRSIFRYDETVILGNHIQSCRNQAFFFELKGRGQVPSCQVQKVCAGLKVCALIMCLDELH